MRINERDAALVASCKLGRKFLLVEIEIEVELLEATEIVVCQENTAVVLLLFYSYESVCDM